MTAVHENRWRTLAVLSLSLIIIGLDATAEFAERLGDRAAA